MTVADKIKTLDIKIKQNETQCDLDKKKQPEYLHYCLKTFINTNI